MAVRDFNEDESKKRKATEDHGMEAKKPTSAEKGTIFNIGLDSDSDSEEAEEFSIPEEANVTDEVLSLKILIALPDGVGGKKFTTYLGLVDSGASGSLGNSKILTSRSTVKKLSNTTTWETKTGTFQTNKVVDFKDVRLPQFTTKRRVDAKFDLFEKSEA